MLILTVAASATSAQNVATRWLRAHPSAADNQDDLGELKAENPEAYAIVKALLTKRSLGLLDPKHPSASFAAPPPAQDSTPTGAAAFAKFATPGELAKVNQVSTDGQASQTALAYPDVAPAPAHHDWLNWKPQNSAADDDAMVSSVLGAVAELKGKAASASSAQRTTNSDGGSSLANDEDLLGSLSPSSVSAPSVEEETPQATSEEKQNPPSSVSAPSVVAETPQATSEEKQNPYLDGVALSNEEPQRPQLRLAAQSTSSSTVRKNVAATPENTLSAWLDGKASPGKAAATQQVATEVPASKPEQNPYTVGLW